MMQAFSNSLTIPGRLLQLSFDPVIRYTTREDMTLMSQSWINWWFTVNDLSSDGRGGRYCTIDIINPDFEWTERLLTDFAPGIGISAWMLYRLPDGTYEYQQDFQGEIYRAAEVHKTDASYVQLYCDNIGFDNRLAPRVQYATEYSIAPGTEVQIGNETLRFE